MPLTVGSLFSGAGLGDLGLEWAGFKHKWFCEIDEYARKVLTLRWPGKKIYEDIQKVDFTKVGKVDVLTGGFPCQDISVAGKGAGIEGERSGLWNEYARAVREIRPKYAIIENSSMLVNRGLDRVLCDLAESGYDAEWRSFFASEFGAPHLRERLFIVAYPSGIRLQGPVYKEDSRKKINTDYWCSTSRAPGKGWVGWDHEPMLCRGDNGLTNFVDRLKCIGNGQMPQITQFIGRLIKEHYEASK